MYQAESLVSIARKDENRATRTWFGSRDVETSVLLRERAMFGDTELACRTEGYVRISMAIQGLSKPT